MSIDVSRPHPDVTEILTSIEKLGLEVVEGRDFVEEDVYFDGRHFKGCKFQHCRIYIKVGIFRLDPPLALENCNFMLDGPAETMKALVEAVNQ